MAEPIKIPIILQNVGQAGAMMGGAAGTASGLGGRAAQLGQRAIMGAEGPGAATVKGLGQIAKQLPGVGMMEDMTKAFKQGGPIGLITAGVAGLMGFVKQIMESSKVFQGIAGSFFKIFGAMADLFLLPFLPLAMKGMQQLMRALPFFSNMGQKASGVLDSIIKYIGGFIDQWKKEGFIKAIGEVLNDAWQHSIPFIERLIYEGTNKLLQAIPLLGVDERNWKVVPDPKDPSKNIVIEVTESKARDPEIDEGRVQSGAIGDLADLTPEEIEKRQQSFQDAEDRGQRNLDRLRTGYFVRALSPVLPDLTVGEQRREGKKTGDMSPFTPERANEQQAMYKFMNNPQNMNARKKDEEGNLAGRWANVQEYLDAGAPGWTDPTTGGSGGRWNLPGEAAYKVVQGQVSGSLSYRQFGGPGMFLAKRGEMGGGGGGITRGLQNLQSGVMDEFFGEMGEQIFDEALKINNYVQEWKSKEGGSTGTIYRWDNQVLGSDLPGVWTGIGDYLGEISNQTGNLHKAVTALNPTLTYGEDYFAELLGELGDAVDTSIGSFSFKFDFPKFSTPTEKINEIAECLNILNACVVANLEAIPLAVQEEGTRIQGMIATARALLDEGLGGTAEFDAVAAAIETALNEYGSSVTGLVSKHLVRLKQEAVKINEMTPEEWESIETGRETSQFGAAVNTAGVFLANRAEALAAAAKQRAAARITPSTPDFEADDSGWVAADTETYTRVQEDDEERVLTATVNAMEKVMEKWAAVAAAAVPTTTSYVAAVEALEELESTFVRQRAIVAVAPAPITQYERQVEEMGEFFGGGGPRRTFTSPVAAPPQMGGWEGGEMDFWSGGMVPGRQGAPRMIRAHGGERIMPNSNPGGGGRAATSNRVMNVVINARGGLAEVLGELQRFEDMDEASFFNSVL